MRRYSPEEIKAIRLELRARLPRDAFEADPKKVFVMLFHVAIVLGCYVAIGRFASTWVHVACAVVAGHGLAVVSFYGHHLSHNVFVRRRWLRTPLEYLVWTLTGQPTTVWRETHNVVHHRNTNTTQDAFRYYAESERSWPHTLYSAILIPNRYNWWSPLVLLTPMSLHLLHANAALFAPGERRRLVITGLGRYGTRERLLIAFELALMVAFQVAVFHVSGGSWSRYVWSGLVPMAVGGLIAGLYTYSQHSLHALRDRNDPFATTTLVLPRWLNWLHLNVAHHTAHHLFEGLNPDHLPLVTELLRRHHPDALDERGPLSAFRAMYRNRLYKADPVPALVAGGQS